MPALYWNELVNKTETSDSFAIALGLVHVNKRTSTNSSPTTEGVPRVASNLTESLPKTACEFSFSTC